MGSLYGWFACLVSTMHVKLYLGASTLTHSGKGSIAIGDLGLVESVLVSLPNRCPSNWQKLSKPASLAPSLRPEEPRLITPCSPTTNSSLSVSHPKISLPVTTISKAPYSPLHETDVTGRSKCSHPTTVRHTSQSWAAPI